MAKKTLYKYNYTKCSITYKHINNNVQITLELTEENKQRELILK